MIVEIRSLHAGGGEDDVHVRLLLLVTPPKVATTYSDVVQVATEWVEVSLPTPLRTDRRTQSLLLAISIGL
jgi:hypothetical protein